MADCNAKIIHEKSLVLGLGGALTMQSKAGQTVCFGRYMGCAVSTAVRLRGKMSDCGQWMILDGERKWTWSNYPNQARRGLEWGTRDTSDSCGRERPTLATEARMGHLRVGEGSRRGRRSG